MQFFIFLVISFVFSTNLKAIEIVDQVKVFDGTKVICVGEKGRFRNRFGAYRARINTLQIIKKSDGKNYVQALGEFKYFRCNEVDGKLALTPSRINQEHQFPTLQLDNKWSTVTVSGSNPEILSIQDGVYKIIGKSSLSVESNSHFRMEILANDLNLDTSQTASPIAEHAFDIWLRAKFKFSSVGRKDSFKTINFGSYRVHFNLERIDRTGSTQKQWQLRLK